MTKTKLKYYSINVILFCALLTPFFKIQAQTQSGLTQFSPLKKQSLQFAWSGYNSTLSSSQNQYSSSSVDAIYCSNGFELGLSYRFNQNQYFKFIPETLVLWFEEEEDNPFSKIHFESRPNEYEINLPFTLFNKFSKWNFKISNSISILQQRSTIESPIAVSIDSSIFIDWETQNYNSLHLVGKFMLDYQLSNFTFGVGAANLRLMKSGASDFPYGIIPKPIPIVSLAYRIWKTKLISELNRTSCSSQAIFDLRLPGLQGAGDTEIAFFYRKGLLSYHFQTLNINLDYAISKKIAIRLGYMQTISPTGVKNEVSYQNWQQSLFLDNEIAHIHRMLPQKTFFLGLLLNLQLNRKIWPIEVEKVHLKQQEFYAIKSALYTQKPVGFIELTNRSSEFVELCLNVSTTSGSGFYQSPSVEIGPGKTQKIDLYFQLNKISQFVSHEQLLISAIVGEQSRCIANQSIVVLNRNIWNGNVQDLTWYVSQNSEVLQQYANKQFKEAGSGNGAWHSESKLTLQKLESFLSKIGERIEYRADPISDFAWDNVQLPEETFDKKTGDCEDLTVYVIALLRIVGIQSAVVDLRPMKYPNRSGNIKQGHLFLLIDSGIEISQISQLGLNEFQGISRINFSGRKTIWLPVETTQLQNGFTAAFRAGVDLYYHKIIESEGIKNGLVYVYDF